jgi:hypothetical protein
MPLVMVFQALQVGNESIVQLLLPSVNNMDGSVEACVALVCGAAAESGQLMLLQVCGPKW